MNIDEKLVLLQGLFLQRSAIDDQIKSLIEDGSADMSDEPEEESSEPAKKTKKRKAGKYSKANPMPQEVTV